MVMALGDESVLVVSRDNLMISLSIDGNSPAVKVVFVSDANDASDPSENRERALDTDEGVVLATQILRAFHPSLLAEHKPSDMDALFDSPEVRAEMQRTNDIM